MRWFRWWRMQRIEAPSQKIELPKRRSIGNNSDEVLRQSKQKLTDALNTKKEVNQVVRASDQFADALQRAMRRSHG